MLLIMFISIKRIERVVNELLQGIEIYKEMQESLFVKSNFRPVREKGIKYQCLLCRYTKLLAETHTPLG